MPFQIGNGAPPMGFGQPLVHRVYRAHFPQPHPTGVVSELEVSSLSESTVEGEADP